MKQTIEIPLPPKGCSQNASFSSHWAVRAKARKQYRQEAFFCAKSVQAERMRGLVCLSVTMYAARVPHDGRYRPTDPDGLISALKAAIDGIVDAGVLTDDNHKCLKWGEVVLFRSAKEHGGRSAVVLTFESEAA